MPDLGPAAFIDRDGVINKELGYVHRVEDFRLIDGSIAGLLMLQSLGFQLIVVTNQAGIAKGYYSQYDFEHLTVNMEKILNEHGVKLTAIYHCPHHPEATIDLYRLECDCRKPAPGMILSAARDHKLDLARSILIGDKISDIQAGRAAGVGCNILVRSGHAVNDDDINLASSCVANLFDAAVMVTQILKHETKGQP